MVYGSYFPQRLFPLLDFFNAEIFLERDCSGVVKQSLPAILYCAEKEMYAIAIANIYFQ